MYRGGVFGHGNLFNFVVVRIFFYIIDTLFTLIYLKGGYVRLAKRQSVISGVRVCIVALVKYADCGFQIGKLVVHDPIVRISGK